MAFNSSARATVYALGLIGCGALAPIAWRSALWASLAGVVLASAWLVGLIAVLAADRRWVAAHDEEPRATIPDNLVLDAVPQPMVMIDGLRVHALNGSARRLFATDDLVMPAPPEMLGDERHMRYEARRWRIDRVTLGDATSDRRIAALIDVEREEQSAESRAQAEMIEVLGHELSNGLAPIASLAESAEAVLASDRPDLDLLREVLGTLGRRADGLHAFAQAYRSLSRLPEPRLASTAIADLADDLARLFAGRWPERTLLVEAVDAFWPLDRDQMIQAAWALLQNAAEATGGEIRLTIAIDEDTLCLAVADEGGGLRPDLAARVFRPFHTTKAGGTGIGLSLARRIAHAHGGTIAVDAHPPTTFRIRLPMG